MLQREKDIGGVKLDLYNHLTQVFDRIMLHHKFDGFEKFEEISLLVKKTYLKIQDPKRDIVDEVAPVDCDTQLALDTVEKYKLLLAEEFKLSKEDKKNYIKDTPECDVEDVIENMAMFENAGISFGIDEHYRLHHSMQRLAKISGATRLRFWGKIDCSQKDYFIVEGEQPNQEELDIPAHIEKRGEGVNKRVYWVTDNILDDWIQLPDANPEHVKIIREFKHIMTGDLNAVVNTNPPFPGKERHFLRAQIARISHTTTIVPNGMYGPSEEEGSTDLVLTEEYKVPGIGELGTAENWAHYYPILLKAGRITHQKPDVPEDQVEDALGALAEADPSTDPLRGLNEDAPWLGQEEVAPWTFAVRGDTQKYSLGDDGETTYATLVIRSLQWPGAVTVCKNGKFASIYMGYGLKFGDVPFNPTSPEEILEDPSEKIEKPEPTPLEAPEEPLEPDTDAKPEEAEAE